MLQSKVFNKKTRGGKIQKVIFPLALTFFFALKKKNLILTYSHSYTVYFLWILFIYILVLLRQQVREVYLRDDIYCGASCCKQCDNSAARLTSSTILVVDTNVVLRQVFLCHLLFDGLKTINFLEIFFPLNSCSKRRMTISFLRLICWRIQQSTMWLCYPLSWKRLRTRTCQFTIE